MMMMMISLSQKTDSNLQQKTAKAKYVKPLGISKSRLSYSYMQKTRIKSFGRSSLYLRESIKCFCID